MLDPDALTIGFARRFATYKRATLILRDMERLRRILTDQARPVQIIFAGKAHPQDEQGKDLIRQVTEVSRDPDLGRRSRLPGRLRHGRRALSGAGRRRVAEHSACVPMRLPAPAA